MQLTKLEIKGFKSFGDKVVINFDEGITGIVGPNGCGKSNVVDSIRWVLGEQKTKALRSDKMENVIFNGTKTRKATQMAEVSLTFNNTKNLLPTEYSQLTLTRRYYRSGDSEYLLNGITCRLKDITNLFLDTGIASNSYAIIELKMVDDILNDKENSRRGLFEEAAGISKFKIRKKETLKKLVETDEDLQRVEDLLYEISKNLKSLEKQAKQAEKYFELKEEYKQNSVSLAKIVISKHRIAYDAIQNQINKENDDKFAIISKISALESDLEKYKKDLLSREKLLSGRQKTLNEQVSKIRQYENEKKIRNERLLYLEEKGHSLKSQVEQDQKQVEKLRHSIESLQFQQDSAEKILLEAEILLHDYKTSYEKEKEKTDLLQKEVKKLNLEVRQNQEKFFQHQKSLEIKEIQLSTLKQELEKTANDASTQSISINEFERKIEELQIEIREKNFELDNLHKLDNNLQIEIAECQTLIEQLKEALSIVNRKIDSKQNEYNLTKSLVENLEGFPEAIKFLKKKAKWGKEAPLLSDIITCEEKYKVTIENYLELFMNYFVVDVEEQAFEAVNILNEASKGKANFFILNSFPKEPITFHNDYPNAIPALSIVEYEEKYASLITYILKGVYILKEGLHSTPSQSNEVLISENGTLSKKLHSISGGSVGLFEGKRLGRAKNLEKLAIEISDLKKSHDEKIHKLRVQQEHINSLKSSTIKKDIDNLRHEINQVNQELTSHKTRYEQFSSLLNSHELKKEDILERISIAGEELDQLKPNVEKGKLTQKELEDKLQQMNKELEGCTNLLSQKSTSYNQQNIQFYQYKNKIGNILHELEFNAKALSNTVERETKNRLELINNENDIKKLLSSGNITEQDLLELYLEKDAIEEGLNEAEKEYYSYRNSIDTLERDIKETQRGKENIDGLLINLNNRLNEVKLEWYAVKERLSVEFEIEIKNTDSEEIEENNTHDDDKEQFLRDKVRALKEKIEKIGPINPMAMEAYEEIKERNDFISSQKDDLIRAKDSLMTTISEIDSVAKATFLEAYQKIKGNFILVFRSLFTEEDDCDLKLSDPSNPLESSIEIIAKPKGKKPLTINQLSGGEKTLTAISLLFAIYLLKPAPFCIFDEVDAPLDDANIDKFNNIIKKFSRESQFIIVTHNKRTMASTDVIYGITMVEQGVSRVVPVDLRALA